MLPSYQLTGPEGAPVILLSNSLGTDRRMWDEQIRALTRQFRVLSYDQRGHGDTPTDNGPYDLASLSGDVLALLDHLGLERVHFAGVSLGGMTGMWLAEHKPARIDRLALLCTSAALAPSAWIERAARVRAHGTGAMVESSLGRWFTSGFGQRPDIAAKFGGMLSAIDDEGYAACCEAIAGMDLLPRLADITAPTLVIAGRDDPATPREHGDLIARNVGARMEIVDDAAHLANVQRADTVNQLLLEHFTGSP